MATHLKRPLVIVLVIFWIGVTTNSLAAQIAPKVEFDSGHLSVIAEGTHLSQILREISRLTGVEIQGLDGVREEVSVRFSGFSLREGLKELLGRVNYVIWEKTLSQGGTTPVLVQVFGHGVKLTPGMVRVEKAPNSESEQTAEESREERLATVHAFASQGNVRELQKSIWDQDSIIQETAFELLAQQDDHRAVSELLRATRSNHHATRLHALQILQHRQQVDEWTTQSILGESLADEELTVKEFAVQALAGRRGPDVILYLRQALRDPEPSVRRAVIQSVAQKGEDFQLLYEALSDSDKSVRSLAALWLKQLTETR